MKSLYIIGVGPGDPELLTLKAVRLLRDLPVLFVPKGRADGKSLALKIVSSIIDLSNKDIKELHFPMIKTRQPEAEQISRWENMAEEIISVLKKSDAAFITLGDPSFYSTFFYLYDRLLTLKPDLRIEIVPGVSSINAAAAGAGLPLGLADERIAIIPANYFDFKEICIDSFDTIVFMKIERNFEDIKRYLTEGMLFKKAVYVSRIGMEGERIIHDIKNIRKDDLDYFSILIIKR